MGDIGGHGIRVVYNAWLEKKLRQKKCRNIPNSLSNCQQIKDTWSRGQFR